MYFLFLCLIDFISSKTYSVFFLPERWVSFKNGCADVFAIYAPVALTVSAHVWVLWHHATEGGKESFANHYVAYYAHKARCTIFLGGG